MNSLINHLSLSEKITNLIISDEKFLEFIRNRVVYFKEGKWCEGGYCPMEVCSNDVALREGKTVVGMYKYNGYEEVVFINTDRIQTNICFFSEIEEYYK